MLCRIIQRQPLITGPGIVQCASSVYDQYAILRKLSRAAFYKPCQFIQIILIAPFNTDH